jgi:hypothetical protein
MQAFEHSGHRRIQRLHRAFSRSCRSAHHSGPPYCNRTAAPRQRKVAAETIVAGRNVDPLSSHVEFLMSETINGLRMSQSVFIR